MSDKREQIRVQCDIILNKVEDGHTNICRARDLSLGGMRLQRLLEPHTGRHDQVKLQFELPGDSEPIWVGATKVYEDEHHVGVRFTDISHQHFVRLRNWLRGQSGAVERMSA